VGIQVRPRVASASTLERLEQRRLLAADPWGEIPKLVGRTRRRTSFPR
jgi:hypothetical protein